MAVTATLKFVLHAVPDSREQEGMVYLALQNTPKGVPARVHLAEAPLAVACTGKMWRTARTRHDDLTTSGSAPLWIVEANVGVHNGSLVAVVKGIQVMARSPAKEEATGQGNGTAEHPARA